MLLLPSHTLFLKKLPHKSCKYPTVKVKEPWLRHTWDYGDLEVHRGENPCLDVNFNCYIANWVHYNVYDIALVDFFFRSPPYTLEKIGMPQSTPVQQDTPIPSFVPPSEHNLLRFELALLCALALTLNLFLCLFDRH